MKSDREPSAGFSLHLADIAVSELCEACDEAGPVPTEALQVCTPCWRKSTLPCTFSE